MSLSSASAREICGSHLHGALEIEVDLLRRAQLVAQRAAHLLERERQPADLVALAACRDGIRELAARHRIRALLESPDRRHELRDGERDDAAARREQHEEEHQQLLERPHHRLAASQVARVEHGHGSEVVAGTVPGQGQPLGAAGKPRRVHHDLIAALADLRALVPRELRRTNGTTADGEDLVVVIDVVHDGRLGRGRRDLAQRGADGVRSRRQCQRRDLGLQLGEHPSQPDARLAAGRIVRQVLVLSKAPQQRHATREQHDAAERQHQLATQ